LEEEKKMDAKIRSRSLSPRASRTIRNQNLVNTLSEAVYEERQRDRKHKARSRGMTPRSRNSMIADVNWKEEDYIKREDLLDNGVNIASPRSLRAVTEYKCKTSAHSNAPTKNVQIKDFSDPDGEPGYIYYIKAVEK